MLLVLIILFYKPIDCQQNQIDCVKRILKGDDSLKKLEKYLLSNKFKDLQTSNHWSPIDVVKSISCSISLIQEKVNKIPFIRLLFATILFC